MAKRCYYQTLEIDRTASDGDIKAAFRKQAMQCHPDRHPGDQTAEHRFKELVDSGLKVVPLSQEMARESGIIRAKYREKIPWGDCLIAGTHIVERADVVLSEDPHFNDIREVKARTLTELKI